MNFDTIKIFPVWRLKVNWGGIIPLFPLFHLLLFNYLDLPNVVLPFNPTTQKMGSKKTNPPKSYILKEYDFFQGNQNPKSVIIV